MGVHATVQSELLKRNEKKQMERNQERVWHPSGDKGSDGNSNDEESGLDDLDQVVSNLLTSIERYGARRALRSKRGSDFILASWRVQPSDIDQVEELGQELGQGAYGRMSIVKVRGVKMACKKINFKSTTSVAEQQNNMCVEMRTLAELQHPNVIRLLGVCADTKDAANMCLLTELSPRGDLRSLLTEAKEGSLHLPLWLRVRMLRGVALAIRHAHAHLPAPIVHRDIQPANVFVASDWTARVAEWGLATGAAGVHSGEEGNRGGLAYAPPEVVTILSGHLLDEIEKNEKEDKNRHELDCTRGNGSSNKDGDGSDLDADGWSRAGDVYSFGVLAWEVLGGDVPWAQKAAKAIYRKEEQIYTSHEQLYQHVVCRKRRPQLLADDVGDDVSAGMERFVGHDATLVPEQFLLVVQEAEQRKSSDGASLSALISLPLLQMVKQCWQQDREARPTMENVTDLVQECEKYIAAVGWAGHEASSAVLKERELKQTLDRTTGTLLKRTNKKVHAAGDEACAQLQEEEELTGFDLTMALTKCYKDESTSDDGKQ